MGLHGPGLVVSKVRGRLPSPPLPASICHPTLCPTNLPRTSRQRIYGKMYLSRLQTAFSQILECFLFKFQHHIAKTKTLTLSMLSPTLTTFRTNDQPSFGQGPKSHQICIQKSSQLIWSNEVMRCDFRLSLLLLTFILVLH